jgi:hypothetical protein
MRGNKSPAPPVSTAPRGGELNPQRLKKDKDNQKKLIDNVISAISNGNLRSSKNTVIESL